MRTARKLRFGIPLLAVVFPVLVTGCGASDAHRQQVVETASAEEAGLSSDSSTQHANETASPASNRPLTEADIQFYLSVMRAAADRLDHPTPADRAALAKLEALNNGASGVDPAVIAQSSDELDLAMELKNAADDRIVRERHLDDDRYQKIKSRIEDAGAPKVGDGGESNPASYTPTQRAAMAQISNDSIAIASHAKEIAALINRVRNGITQ